MDCCVTVNVSSEDVGALPPLGSSGAMRALLGAKKKEEPAEEPVDPLPADFPRQGGWDRDQACAVLRQPKAVRQSLLGPLKEWVPGPLCFAQDGVHRSKIQCSPVRTHGAFSLFRSWSRAVQVAGWSAQGVEPWELAVASPAQVEQFLLHCKVVHLREGEARPPHALRHSLAEGRTAL